MTGTHTSIEARTPEIRRRLLAIFAHPDDESFGPGATLARYACEGVEIHICIVTDGAAGSYEPGALAGEISELSKLRRGELERAVEVLGATLHQLHYRDSGMEGAPDNLCPDSLYQAPLETVAADIVHLIRTLKPQILLTHDPTGGYFHPDHIKVSRAVTCALNEAADPQRYPDTGAPWQAKRLYYTVIRRAVLTWQLWLMRLRGQDPRRVGRNQDIDLTRVGVPDSQIHVRLNVGRYVEIKEAASRCHQSQGGGILHRGFPRWLSRYLQRYDYYIQAYPAPARPHRDFFAGLP